MKNLHSLISHIKFLFKATNQHGVHSPFVYNFVTKGLYTKEKFASKKSTDILLKSIAYFNTENLKIDTESNLYKNFIKKKIPTLKKETQVYDAIFLPDTARWSTIFQIKEAKNTSWVFIHDIHRNKESTLQWNSIINLKEVTVSIDLFYCGILFFRKEQEKEHFKIRY